jgi:hypothetical protein
MLSQVQAEILAQRSTMLACDMSAQKLEDIQTPDDEYHHTFAVTPLSAQRSFA